MTQTRRDFLKTAAVGAAALLASRPAFAEGLLAAPIAITVYKDPECGCCKEWVKHIAQNGFAPKTHDLPDLTETKATLGVPAALHSCHTAVSGRYVFEGHVPADLVKKLLTERPANVVGLAVPGMPLGSPGMEMGSRKDPYDVIAFTRDGKRSVYARRNAPA